MWAKAASRASQIAGTAADLKSRRDEDASRRALATNILDPNAIADEWDGSRVLMTTLGGSIRAITREDLEAFKRNIKAVGKKLKNGITAKQVIELSLAEDRERARQQIRVAIPAGGNKGVIRFTTNAGPNSDKTRHYVTVNLVSFQKAIASPDKSIALARWLAKTQPILFDCDCGRHTYWYRYIATIGKFNAGRVETGYPKIRNPKLSGVACKHVLKVMAELQSSSFVHGFIAKMIDSSRAGLSRQDVRMTKAEAEAQAKKQISRPREIGVSLSQKQMASIKSKSARKPPALSRLPASKMNAEQALKVFMEQSGISAAEIMAFLNVKGK